MTGLNLPDALKHVEVRLIIQSKYEPYTWQVTLVASMGPFLHISLSNKGNDDSILGSRIPVA